MIEKGAAVSVPTPPDNPVSNYVVSLLRTWVPVAWGSALAWAVTQIPALEPYLNSPGMVAIGGALAGVLTGLWYLLWRTVEKKLPAGLTRILLGANSRPLYVPGGPAGGLRGGEPGYGSALSEGQFRALVALQGKYGESPDERL